MLQYNHNVHLINWFIQMVDTWIKYRYIYRYYEHDIYLL